MKKWMVILLSVICVLGSAACAEKKEEKLHYGLNAEVVEIDHETRSLYVKDADDNNEVFGERCFIDCRRAIDGQNIIYVNYNVENGVQTIEFDDLQVGDDIILVLKDREKDHAMEGSAIAEQIQLGTQRLN